MDIATRQIYGRVSSLERAILQQSGCTDNSTYAVYQD